MRLYVTPKGRWAGTQADATALAKEGDGGWEQRDIPTDKDGLLGFLNEHRVNAIHAEARAMIEPVAISRPLQPHLDTIVGAAAIPAGVKLDNTQRAAVARNIAIEQEIEAAPLARALALFDACAYRINELVAPARSAAA